MKYYEVISKATGNVVDVVTTIRNLDGSKFFVGVVDSSIYKDFKSKKYKNPKSNNIYALETKVINKKRVLNEKERRCFDF